MNTYNCCVCEKLCIFNTYEDYYSEFNVHGTVIICFEKFGYKCYHKKCFIKPNYDNIIGINFSNAFFCQEDFINNENNINLLEFMKQNYSCSVCKNLLYYDENFSIFHTNNSFLLCHNNDLCLSKIITAEYIGIKYHLQFDKNKINSWSELNEFEQHTAKIRLQNLMKYALCYKCKNYIHKMSHVYAIKINNIDIIYHEKCFFDSSTQIDDNCMSIKYISKYNYTDNDPINGTKTHHFKKCNIDLYKAKMKCRKCGKFICNENNGPIFLIKENKTFDIYHENCAKKILHDKMDKYIGAIKSTKKPHLPLQLNDDSQQLLQVLMNQYLICLHCNKNIKGNALFLIKEDGSCDVCHEKCMKNIISTKKYIGSILDDTKPQLPFDETTKKDAKKALIKILIENNIESELLDAEPKCKKCNKCIKNYGSYTIAYINNEKYDIYHQWCFIGKYANSHDNSYIGVKNEEYIHNIVQWSNLPKNKQQYAKIKLKNIKMFGNVQHERKQHISGMAASAYGWSPSDVKKIYDDNTQKNKIEIEDHKNKWLRKENH